VILGEMVGNVVFGSDMEVADWVASHIPEFKVDENSTALGVIRDGELIAGVIYERYNGVHVEVSIATADPRWAKRSTLKTLFGYPFNQLRCKAITVLVPSSNMESLNLATKLGFRPEAFIKYSAHDGSALVVLKMFKEDCHWIEEKNYGQRRSSTNTT